MNLFECIGGGSSELQETVLWTNSSPTSNFAAQDVTLSDNISNYDYIKIYWRYSTTAGSASSSILIPSSEITRFALANNYNVAAIGRYYSGFGFRSITYVSDTKINIGNNAYASTNNAGSIPITICGLKYATPKPSGTETTLWENSSPTASYAAQDVTLSDSIANYRKLKFTFRVSTTVATESSVEISVSEFQSNNQSVSANNYSCFASPNVTDGSSGYVRRFWYVGPTTAHYYDCQKVNSQGSKNTFNIPVSIKGIS